MEKTKNDLLETTYKQFMKVCFNEMDPAVLEDITDQWIMGFGTTFDEKVFSQDRLKELLRSQQTQSEGLQMTWDTKLLHRHISEDENTAVYGNDVFLHVQMDAETIEMYLRVSVVLEYTNTKWLVVHWHASKPEEVESEKDTFGIDTWKEKAEALEKVVAERTADLVVKNRELEIEAALERVRTVAMSMNKPGNMLEVCKTISHQLGILSVKEIRNVQTAIFYKEKGTYINFEYYQKHDKTFITETNYNRHEKHADFAETMQNGNGKSFELNLTGNEVREWIQYQKTTNVFIDDFLNNATSLNYYWYSLGPVALGISSYEPLQEADKTLFYRFVKVFELAYRRFLDIEKAEAQTRESQIELALERVRASTMAMQHSNELAETSSILFQQIKELGFETWSCGFCIWKENNLTEVWMGADSGGLLPPMLIPYKKEPTHHDIYKAHVKDVQSYHKIWEGKALEKHYAFLRTLPSVKDAIDILESSGLSLPERQCYYVGFFKQGYLLLITKDPNTELKDLSSRFAKVFDQTYTRFLDLQKAEAQTRESQIELALERVRARTMAMQNSEELSEVSFLLDTQVRLLGIKTQGCAFNIYGPEESTEWFSNEVGIMPTYKTPMKDVFLRYHDAGRNGELIHIERFEEEACVAHYEYLCTLPGMGEGLKAMIEAGGSFPKRQTDHVVYFKYGYLLFLTLEDVPQAHDIFIRFGKVFEQTYTRFLDLQKAEAQTLRAEEDLVEIKAARKKAEETLIELQLAQKQLIQSEKMASLGELTAGIAHEIQNPLNFVNNFSEVNKELLIEMKDEMQKGNYEDAKEIVDDIIKNEVKINHHGKRADAIVKGMLQHSSNSTGKKELTNINALADEYLRLAYHGLRAKDKNFNATLKTDFDSSIGNINIIPQDIGRVILNLITNAFYAVNERTLSAASAPTAVKYEPTVSVSTKKIGDKIEISVADNGSGIPQKILDKIFQPFFTTKPTGQGTGLGLSLAYDIVKAHGGELKVGTKEGEGSEFKILIPA